MISRVAIRLDKSDMVDFLVKEIEENKIQIDSRLKKYGNLDLNNSSVMNSLRYLDAYLLSKGLNRLNNKIEDKSNGK